MLPPLRHAIPLIRRRHTLRRYYDEAMPYCRQQANAAAGC